MSAQVTLTLSDRLYERVQELARLHQRKLPETIIEHLEETLPYTENAQSADDTRSKQAKALASEEAAYIELHAQLKVTHLGRYVALYQGELIDEDNELGAMVERVRSKLPNQVVWMTQVQDEPIQTIVKRGNRLTSSQW